MRGYINIFPFLVGPRFRYTNATYIQQVNHNIILSCALQEETNPPSEITFSTTAEHTSNVHWLPYQKLIKVHTMVVYNSGNYNCTASNAYGNATLWYILDIGCKSYNSNNYDCMHLNKVVRIFIVGIISALFRKIGIKLQNLVHV